MKVSPNDGPDKYWPKWVLDMVDNPPETEKPSAPPKVETEQLQDGCIVYKPDWTARPRRGHWVRAKLAH
jgi:hypothetical protein